MGGSKAGMAPYIPRRSLRINREACRQVGFLKEVRLLEGGKAGIGAQAFYVGMGVLSKVTAANIHRFSCRGKGKESC